MAILFYPNLTQINLLQFKPKITNIAQIVTEMQAFESQSFFL